LEEDGIIDKAQLEELLCINSYINFIQKITGPIVDGYADITKCTRDDFLYFVNFTKWYYGEGASESKERGTVSLSLLASILPAYGNGMLPTLQIPNLYVWPPYLH